MVEFMLANVICAEFEKVVDKGHSEDGKAMHIGFHMRPENDDQYLVAHMYLFAPGNYVYVVTQEERIDKYVDRHVGKMKLLCYHDSCWRGSVLDFLCQNARELRRMSSFKKASGWYDVLTLTEEEKTFLRKMEAWRHGNSHPKGDFEEKNPFDQRGIWVEK